MDRLDRSEIRSHIIPALPILNVLIFVIVLVVHILAAQRIFNGVSMRDVFDLHYTKFTPASYGFIVWYFIFIGLGIFVIFQALPAYRNNGLIRRVASWFPLLALGLFAWPFFWNYRIMWPAVIAVLWVLAISAAIYIRLGVDYSKKGMLRTIEASEGPATQISIHEFWLVQVPFSLLLGFTLVMTILNLWIAATPARDPVADVWTYSGWSAMFLTLLTMVAVGLVVLRHDFVFAAVIAWSQFAIAAGHRHDPVVDTAGLINGFLVFCTALFAAFFVLWRYSTHERVGYTEIKG
jgi:hypothetical protein